MTGNLLSMNSEDNVRHHVASGGCPGCTCCNEGSCDNKLGGTCTQNGKDVPLQQWWECPCVESADERAEKYGLAVREVRLQQTLAIQHLEYALDMLKKDVHPAGVILSESQYARVSWLYCQTLTAHRNLVLDFTP
jgi:hypothetical protein